MRHISPLFGRRVLAAPLLPLLAAAALMLAPVPAGADTSSTLTVIGTSDLSDSGLMTNVIQPAFQKAFPQYTFKYIGTATGTAISNAESGAVGASVLIVHAASLENHFVANGYSYEKYGRAIFTNDFVFAGPSGDPAGVAANGANNIAQAFADVASAGIAGKATFVSRGGTPGTTVEEHQIWALVQSSNLASSGLLLCAVNATAGGGMTPIAAGHGVTASGQPCPNGGALPTATALPAWYVATGLTQGPNVLAANACTGHASGANSCYVLTDRGTFDYLASGTDPAGAVPNLKILTRGPQPASAPGGVDALTNYFHAYIVNPAKPGQAVNLTAAQDFVNLLTSPALQAQLKTYLPSADPGGPPFVADASPVITAKLPSTYRAGKPATVKGTLTNAQPGYPAPANARVTVDRVVAGLPVPVAGGKTNAKGAFTIRFVPPVNGSYELTTSQIAQVEDANLNPVFSDLLSPAATTPVRITVHSAVTKLFAKSRGGKALVYGTIAPGTGHVKGVVTLLARAVKGGFRKVATHRLGSGDGNFAVLVGAKPGKWQYKVTYADPRQVVGATSKTIKLTVGAKPASSVKLASARAASGKVTVSAVASPTAPKSGAKVELLAFKATTGAPRFATIASASIKGKTKLALHGRLARKASWVLELVYVRNGQPSSYSALRSIAVK
ncbi:MAG TPA: substrate-binding domain-containing protein [Solirubrobacteraceae bacterium]